MDMDMEMERSKAFALKKDMIGQLESIVRNASQLLDQLSRTDSEGRLIGTDGTIYGLIALTALASARNEAEYNALVRLINSHERIQKRK